MNRLSQAKEVRTRQVMCNYFRITKFADKDTAESPFSVWLEIGDVARLLMLALIIFTRVYNVDHQTPGIARDIPSGPWSKGIF